MDGKTLLVLTLLTALITCLQINVQLVSILGLSGGVVVSTVASQQEGSVPGWGLSVWNLHVLPMYVWVLSGYSGFLPPSINMHVRLIGVSKLSLGVSVHGCLSLCGPVMDWRPVMGVPCQMIAGIGSSPPEALNWIKRV